MVFFSAVVLYAIMVVFGYVEFSQTWFVLSIGIDMVYELFKFLIFFKDKEPVPFPKALIFYVIIALFSGTAFSLVWFVVARLVDGIRYISRLVPELAK